MSRKGGVDSRSTRKDIYQCTSHLHSCRLNLCHSICPAMTLLFCKLFQVSVQEEQTPLWRENSVKFLSDLSALDSLDVSLISGSIERLPKKLYLKFYDHITYKLFQNCVIQKSVQICFGAAAAAAVCKNEIYKCIYSVVSK